MRLKIEGLECETDWFPGIVTSKVLKQVLWLLRLALLERSLRKKKVVKFRMLVAVTRTVQSSMSKKGHR